MLDPELLKILACPWCVTRPEPAKPTLAKGELELHTLSEMNGLKCKQCGRFYKIEKNGIPNLLIDEAIMTADSAAKPN